MGSEPVRCVLHIGPPKCGSSALQHALSAAPEPEASIRDLDGFIGAAPPYCAISANGLVHGTELVARAATKAAQYWKTARPTQLAALTDDQIAVIRADLSAIADRGRVPVLSCERFYEEVGVVAEHRLLERLGLAATVLAYVRAPILWINSEWWHHGTWSEHSFESFIDWAIGRARWADHLRGWQGVPGVERTEVRLLPDDVVSDFLMVDASTDRHNNALPAPVARAIRGLPHLRQVHNADLDHAINRWAGELPGPSPWVLDRPTMDRILAETSSANAELLDLLRPDDACRMRRDPAWWEPSPRASEPPRHAAAAEDLAVTVEVLARALLSADAKVRSLTTQSIRRAAQPQKKASSPDNPQHG